ncbi:MAG: NgoFVII family restriction endonuclease, partial [Chloroflexi bacterium]|nr:NgoFVII family restriction endonuclease [Chloroflexota bacterium]
MRFYVIKDVIAHAKIYLLEREGLQRVIVGSANLSETAFSGRQAETLIVFDNDETAWKHYWAQYEAVRDISTNHLPLREEPIQVERMQIDESPGLKEAESSKDGITLYVPAEQADEANYAVPQILSRIEVIKPIFRRALADVRPNKNGVLHLTPKIAKQMTHIVLSRQIEEGPKTYLSLNGGQFTLSDKEMSLDPDEQEVRNDVANWLEFFGNYDNGFVGDVPRLQRDYYTFMCWFYFSPLMCDLRNAALRRNSFSFDQPMFAVLYGSSNCGKTSLVETLMTSMFSFPHIVETQDFTRGKLRGLQQSYKRFPVVFDDVARERFNRHASEIIKDETIPYAEYPCFALSMNAEARSFPPEIVKRCLMIYTRTALPGDDTAARRRLQRSVAGIREGLSTALYLHSMPPILSKVAEVIDS